MGKIYDSKGEKKKTWITNYIYDNNFLKICQEIYKTLEGKTALPWGLLGHWSDVN